MIHRVIITAMLLATPPAVLAEEITEQDKIDALKLGYALNGNSMVRWGAIDLSSLRNPMAPYPLQQQPIDPYGPPRPLIMEPEK
jgi:hypothetical protein